MDFSLPIWVVSHKPWVLGLGFPSEITAGFPNSQLRRVLPTPAPSAFGQGVARLPRRKHEVLAFLSPTGFGGGWVGGGGGGGGGVAFQP